MKQPKPKFRVGETVRILRGSTAKVVGVDHVYSLDDPIEDYVDEKLLRKVKRPAAKQSRRVS
jgi:hypothetical protein